MTGHDLADIARVATALADALEAVIPHLNTSTPDEVTRS